MLHVPAASTVLSPVGIPSPRLANDPFSSMQATLPITTASIPQTIYGQKKNLLHIKIAIAILLKMYLYFTTYIIS